MTINQIKSKISNIKVWKRHDEEAPHKPLLLLLALSWVAEGRNRLHTFSAIELPLKNLLIKFGPNRKTYHPEYPFWRLQNDGLWEVTGAERLKRRKGNSDPLKSELIKENVKGGFPEPIFNLFVKDRHFIDSIVKLILKVYFPSAMHKELIYEVKISL